MANNDQLLPTKDPFFPKGSPILLVAHFGISIFFLVVYFLLHSNIETFKMMILVYYTLFSMFFLFAYYKQLRVRRIFIIWSVIAALQFIFYIINCDSTAWDKWSVPNVLTTLTGLPLVLILYAVFGRQSLNQTGKELTIGVRSFSEASSWDITATIGIPIIALLVCLF